MIRLIFQAAQGGMAALLRTILGLIQQLIESYTG